MKNKIKISLCISLTVIMILSTMTIASFAISSCKNTRVTFKRNYNESMGCSSTDASCVLNNKSAKTICSAPSGCKMETYVAAWKSNGSLIDSATHNGSNAKSTASIIWVVAEPVKTFHQADVQNVPGCNGEHIRQYI